MALDEAIAVARSKNLVPNTLRFFRWKPSAVSIGYFQGMLEEVDTAACDSKGIDYVRRRTGGGAVYHDKDGEFTYSLFINQEHCLISKDFQETYGTLCSGLVRGLRFLEVQAEFKPINDIVVGGKKVSGNAQTRGMNVVHQHGTILLKVDSSLMFLVLKGLKGSPTSLYGLLGREISFEELKEALIKGFETSFKIKLIQGTLTKFEEQKATELKNKKYAKKGWNFKR
jgi:lipoate-protein ligase A